MKLFALSVLVCVPAAAICAAKGPDAAFYDLASEGGIADVELGQLAEAKSHNSAMKDFGGRMVRVHQDLNERLKSVAAARSVSLLKTPSVEHVAMKEKLEGLSGKTFDKFFVKGVTKDHEDAIAQFQREAESGSDADAKSYAAAGVVALKSELEGLRRVASDSGID